MHPEEDRKDWLREGLAEDRSHPERGHRAEDRNHRAHQAADRSQLAEEPREVAAHPSRVALPRASSPSAEGVGLPRPVQRPEVELQPVPSVPEPVLREQVLAHQAASRLAHSSSASCP